jgi:site-specific recombinase XerD
MLKFRRAHENPVSHLDGLNMRTDRRHDRRALTVGELVKLLDTAYSGPVHFDMCGPDRAMLYWLAVETGLRAGELRSLTRSSFDLEGDSSTVTVAAEYSKRRRQDTLPLRPELAAELRTFLGTKTQAASVFPTMPQREHLAKMFREDLTAASIAYRDDAKLVADFHSLRHTFISNLARGGVHPKVAQALARHSTITLTMDRYSHTLVGEQSAALAALPDLSTATRQEARATGTDGANPPSGDLASCLAFSGRSSGIPIDSRRSNSQNGADEKTPENGEETPISLGNAEIRRGGRVADCTGLENRHGVSHREFESRPLRSWL